MSQESVGENLKNVVGYMMLEIKKLDFLPPSGISQYGRKAVFYHHIPKYASLSEPTRA